MNAKDLAEAGPSEPSESGLKAENSREVNEGGPLARISDISTGHPVKTLAAFVLIAVVLMIPASQLKTDTSIESVFGDDPDVRKHLELSDKFGEQELVTVVVDCTNSSAEVAMKYLRDISGVLRDSIWFRDISYLSNLDFAGEKDILYLPEDHLSFLLDPDATPESIPVSYTHLTLPTN